MPELNRGPALARAAEAMLRSLGGTEVSIRCPVAPAADAAKRELGLEGPVVENFAVSPVVVRTVAQVSDSRARYEFLFAPATLASYLADRRQTAEEFFAAAAGIVHDGRLLAIVDMTSDTFAGTPYLYHVIATE